MTEDSETRGDRVKAIRELLGLKQPEFAARLNEAAERLKLPAIYHNTKVSKMETGSRGVDLNDAYVVAALDPENRGTDWITFGTRRKHTGGPRKREDEKKKGRSA